MNISKFTQKSVEAIQNCEKVAAEYGNQEIDQEHLIYSLITLDDSLIIKLINLFSILNCLKLTPVSILSYFILLPSLK